MEVIAYLPFFLLRDFFFADGFFEADFRVVFFAVVFFVADFRAADFAVGVFAADLRVDFAVALRVAAGFSSTHSLSPASAAVAASSSVTPSALDSTSTTSDQRM
jgi:hypothetical protein